MGPSLLLTMEKDDIEGGEVKKEINPMDADFYARLGVDKGASEKVSREG